MPPTPRALVIGAGPTTVHAHLPALTRLRDRGSIVLAGICDIDPQRTAAACRRFGFLEGCGDGLTALQRTDIDVVYIFGSAQLHYEYGLIALQSGKHLFVEKPIAPSYAQAVTMAETAARNGLIAGGGLNRRFFKSLQTIREQSGRAGWRYAEAVFHKAEFGNRPPFGATTWLGANGIHVLDALLFMMGGVPDHLSAMAGDSTGGSAGAFSAVMRWPDGAQGIFLCNNNAGYRREEYVFHALAETYSVDGDGLTVHKGGTSTRMAFPSIDDGFVAEHEAFLQAIRTGTEPINSIAAIAPSMYVAELIESGYSGQVKVPRVAPRDSTAPKRTVSDSILIVHSPELQPLLGPLLHEYQLVSLEDVRNSTGQRPDIVGAVLGRGSQPLTGEILDRLPQLRIVGIMALSLARHEPETLLARGITVVNASAAYAASVAEFALGLAILGRRRAFASHAVMRAGSWGTEPKPSGLKGMLHRHSHRVRPAIRAVGLEPFFLKLWRKSTAARNTASGTAVRAPRDLQGAVVGLLGWGENARVFATHLLSIGARILVYSEHARAEDIRAAGASVASLGEALAADLVSLHRGLTASTRHFLGSAELSKLRPGCVLINTARGALIEPHALFERLRKGDIFACLDTYEEEPLAASHPLRGLPNVFLTAHIAGGSRDMHAAAAGEVIRKVIAHLGGNPTGSISAERLKTMT